MSNMNYLKRLSFHGGKLVWRVAAIMLPVIGYSFWKMLISSNIEDEIESDEPEFGYLDNFGTPEYSNVTDAQWEAYYEKRV